MPTRCFDQMIGVDEVVIELPRQQVADGGFSRTHEAGQDDIRSAHRVN